MIFHLNCSVHRCYSRCWSKENPLCIEGVHAQYYKRFMVWLVIWGSTLTGPYFLLNAITGESYLHLLETFLIAHLEVVPLAIRTDIWFPHDGAPPHFAKDVRSFMGENIFPRKWIGRRGMVEWPTRSPDLTLWDFFLWGHLKSVV